MVKATSLTIDELDNIRNHWGTFETLSQWIRSYLAEPHEDLGRAGTVCPYAPAALRRDALRLAVVSLQPANRPQQVIDCVLRYKRLLEQQAEEDDPDRVLHAVLIAFPDVSSDEAPDLIDGAQTSLKPTFVKDGLMIGEFHERNRTPGLHNTAFSPLCSPVPLLALRRMVPSDVVFLCRAEDPPSVRAEYLNAYLSCQKNLTIAERASALALRDRALRES